MSGALNHRTVPKLTAAARAPRAHVHSHVRTILSKLGLRSRIEILALELPVP